MVSVLFGVSCVCLALGQMLLIYRVGRLEKLARAIEDESTTTITTTTTETTFEFEL